MSSKVSREDLALYIFMTFQDEENRVKRESFQIDNIMGMEDTEFQQVDSSSNDDHSTDGIMQIDGDLEDSHHPHGGVHDPLKGLLNANPCKNVVKGKSRICFILYSFDF